MPSNRSELRKAGIATVALAVIIIIIVAAVGLGSYYYLSSTSNPTTTSQSTSGSTSQTTTSSSSVVSSTSTATSSTSSSSSTQSTETSTNSTVTCSTTFSTTTGGQPQLIDYSSLFGNFSQLAISYRYTNMTSLQVESMNSSYTVQSMTPWGSFKNYSVSLVFASGSSQDNASFVYSTNGNFSSVTVNGQPLPSAFASAIVVGLMAMFTLALKVNSDYSGILSGAYLTQVNQTQVTLGSTTLSVTNYKAANTPITYSYCGFTSVIQSMNIQIGQVSGSTFGSIITYMSFIGTEQSSGTPTQANFVLQITSITKASY